MMNGGSLEEGAASKLEQKSDFIFVHESILLSFQVGVCGCVVCGHQLMAIGVRLNIFFTFTKLSQSLNCKRCEDFIHLPKSTTPVANLINNLRS